MKENLHPAIKELEKDLSSKKISRRDFIRYSTLLGLSAYTAAQTAGLVFPGKVFAAKIRRGGTFKIASGIQKVMHPAQLSWVEPTNMLRQVAEYLTYTDINNITHPYLLKSWQPDQDLKTWTLNLRKGIKFNNGDPFTAEDVLFSMNQWLNKDVGSSLLGLIGSYLSPSGIEKVSDYQIKLHLKRPEIAVPEHLFHYPAMILNHKTFEGDFIKAPHGTGPYNLTAYQTGERCILQRRKDYWQKGADGQPFPYLDKMEFIDMGDEMSPRIAAIRAGEIDMIDLATTGGTSAYQALKDVGSVKVTPVPTAQTRVLRMRVDIKPWDDNRVRTALKLCQHPEKILSLAYFGQGLQGQNFHVYPGHPEYCKKPIPKYDPEKASSLLKQAGYKDGLSADLSIGGDWTDIVRYAEILKQDAAPAGFKLNIKTMPRSQYWEKWTEVALGVTPWMHRPLGTMVLNLGYTGDIDGNPVSWNETRWIDKEFSDLLKQANGTIDLEKRRQIFCKLEEIQMQRGSIGIPYWQNNWLVTTKRVQDAAAHPSGYMLFNNVWLAS